MGELWHVFCEYWILENDNHVTWRFRAADFNDTKKVIMFIILLLVEGMIFLMPAFRIQWPKCWLTLCFGWGKRWKQLQTYFNVYQRSKQCVKSWSCIHNMLLDYVGHYWYSTTRLCHADGCRCPGTKYMPGHLQSSCWLDYYHNVTYCHIAGHIIMLQP